MKVAEFVPVIYKRCMSAPGSTPITAIKNPVHLQLHVSDEMGRHNLNCNAVPETVSLTTAAE
eukprot:scaffold66472_cov25-Prasinocladus_malaysianus.AAC.1